MNREQTIEAIKVMQAWVDGLTIQAVQSPRDRHPAIDYEWTDAHSIDWDWFGMTYRVKPYPEIFHVVSFPDGHALAYKDAQSAKEASCTHEGATIKKFVEVMEDEAKPAYDAGLPPATIIPPLVRPLLRHFMVGDKGKTVGGWAYNVRAPTDNGHLYVEHNDNGLPSQVRRQYEMIHAKDGIAGAAGPDHQLLPPELI